VLVALTNPKTIFFYVAFFPQFLDTALPAAAQLAAMSVAFVLIAGICDSGYAALAGRLRRFLVDARRRRIRHGLTGALFLGTGLGIALARRAD
jgi:threonine/homoserine/homoserine lactone efflux protein